MAESSFFSSGVKHAETIMNHSKLSFSAMFCVSAAGDMLPPMVLHKHDKSIMYTSWCNLGPDYCVLLGCESGWFGRNQFEAWFVDVSSYPT
jgi:hypothetical protein